MKFFLLLATCVSILVYASSTEVNTCVDTDPYTGQASAFSLYDTWLATSSDIATSTCQNHEAFYAAGDDSFAAIGYTPFEDAVACGMCLSVTSEYGITEFLTVIDSINTVDPGDIQVPLSVAQRLAGNNSLEDNGVDISWQFITCSIDGNLQYRFEQGATTDNSAHMMIANGAVGVRSVSIDMGSGTNDLQRSAQGMYFSLPSGTVTLPFDVIVTSATYEVVEFTVNELIGDSVFRDTDISFQGICGTVPTSSPTSATNIDGDDANDDDQTSSASLSSWRVLSSLICASALAISV